MLHQQHTKGLCWRMEMDQTPNKGSLRDDHLLVASFSSSSTSSSVSGISTASSLESDSFEEVTSPAASSSNDDVQLGSLVPDPLNDMSCLFQQLPIKRGLSKFYQGKSQSFTSLTNVRSLEDLAKPENPYNKRLKSCRSYAGGLSERHGVSRAVSKRGIRGSCSSLSARKGSSNFMANRPPIPPHRPTTTNTISNHTVLFA